MVDVARLEALLAEVSPALYAFGIGIVVLESVVFAKTRPGRDRRSRILSIKCGALGFGFEFLFHASAFFAAQMWIYQYRWFELGQGWEVFALCALINDAMFYLSHFLQHHVRFLWAVHCVHHSPKQYDLTTGICGSVLGPLVTAPFYLWIPLLGIHPLIFLICDKPFKFVGLAYHTDVVPKLGPLEYLFVTPSAHRVHHASDEKYLDRNFGGFLIVFDRLFGTYKEEKETPTYGLVKKWHSYSVWECQVHELRDLWRDARNASTFADALRYFYKPPGWRSPTSRTSSQVLPS